MDMTTHTTITSPPKSPEPEPETPTRIQPAKPISFSNGVIKRHHPPTTLLFAYKECLKNHAAALGSHALDGCGEFMPSPSSVSTDPTSLKCAACGCHRNFHRREQAGSNDTSIPPPPPSSVAATIEYQPHHRHHPPPPQQPPQLAPPPPRSPNSSSPPPISSSYMLLSLSGTNNNNNNNNLAFSGPHQTGSRKRFRTKFSQFQKEKMHEFADRVGWKMQKRDEDDVREFCRQIGVDKNVLKVWMHNNKNNFNRRDVLFSAVAGAAEIHRVDNSGGGLHAPVPAGETNDNNGGGNELHHSVSSGGGGFESDSGGGGAHGGNVNGSSSS